LSRHPALTADRVIDLAKLPATRESKTLSFPGTIHP
jgi:hypothetical protein